MRIRVQATVVLVIALLVLCFHKSTEGWTKAPSKIQMVPSIVSLYVDPDVVFTKALHKELQRCFFALQFLMTMPLRVAIPHLEKVKSQSIPKASYVKVVRGMYAHFTKRHPPLPATEKKATFYQLLDGLASVAQAIHDEVNKKNEANISKGALNTQLKNLNGMVGLNQNDFDLLLPGFPLSSNGKYIPFVGFYEIACSKYANCDSKNVGVTVQAAMFDFNFSVAMMLNHLIAWLDNTCVSFKSCNEVRRFIDQQKAAFATETDAFLRYLKSQAPTQNVPQSTKQSSAANALVQSFGKVLEILLLYPSDGNYGCVASDGNLKGYSSKLVRDNLYRVKGKYFLWERYADLFPGTKRYMDSHQLWIV